MRIAKDDKNIATKSKTNKIYKYIHNLAYHAMSLFVNRILFNYSSKLTFYIYVIKFTLRKHMFINRIQVKKDQKIDKQKETNKKTQKDDLVSEQNSCKPVNSPFYH